MIHISANLTILHYNWGLLLKNGGTLLRGLLVALEVASISLIVSVLGGFLLAFMRLSIKPLRGISIAYLNIFRGIPILVGAIWVYFGLSLVAGINFTVLEAGVIALVLLYSAYLSEIFRSALLAVAPGQREAGKALGLGSIRIFVVVVFPQAIKIALPNVSSMFIGMIKDTSVLTVIGLPELLNRTQTLVGETYQPFVFYTGAAVIYVVATFVVDKGGRALEAAYSVPPHGLLSKVVRRRRSSRIEELSRSAA